MATITSKLNPEQITDPWRALIAGILRQAVQDLKRPARDPLRALDASIFLLTDAPLYCEAAGWAVDPADLEVLIGNLHLQKASDADI